MVKLSWSARLLDRLNPCRSFAGRREFLSHEDAATFRFDAQLRQLSGEPGVAAAVRGGAALCIGCGEGGELVALRRLGAARVVGVDTDAGRVDHARALATTEPGIEAHLGDGERLPFSDEVFDFVLCSEVLEHVSDPSRLLEEVARVLRPGGTLYLTFPSFSSVKGPHLWHIVRVPFAQHVVGLAALRAAAAARYERLSGQPFGTAWDNLNGITVRQAIRVVSRTRRMGISWLRVYTPFPFLKPVTLIPFLDDLAADSVRIVIRKGSPPRGYVRLKFAELFGRVRNWPGAIRRRVVGR
jgi:SAM-dependent methyltransferase